VSWVPDGPSYGGRIDEVDVLNLDGTLRHRHRLARPVKSAVSLGAELTAVHCGASVIALQNGPEAWRVDMQPSDHPFSEIAAFGSQRLLVKQFYNWFMLLNGDGSVAYRFDPEALAAAQPGTSWADFSKYTPWPTSDADRVLLLDGSSAGKLLRVSTGALQPLTVDVSLPAGFTFVPGRHGGRLLLVSATHLRVRSIALP
jgi:hypothetical protein